MSREELEKLVIELEEEMFAAAEELRFEYAAKLRDEIKELGGSSSRSPPFRRSSASPRLQPIDRLALGESLPEFLGPSS